MAVAQQLVKTMNSTITNMNVPGSMNPMQVPPQFYYAMIEGNQAGPFSEQELSRLITEKKIFKETYIWKPGLPQWEIAGKIAGNIKVACFSSTTISTRPINQ